MFLILSILHITISIESFPFVLDVLNFSMQNLNMIAEVQCVFLWKVSYCAARNSWISGGSFKFLVPDYKCTLNVGKVVISSNTSMADTRCKQF